MIADLIAKLKEEYSKKAWKSELEGDDFYNYNGEDFYQYARKDYGKEDWTDEELMMDHIDERFHEFISELQGIGNAYEGKIKLFRAMSVADADEFTFYIANGTPIENYTGVGIYWSWDEDRAQAHWGGGGKGDVLVEACAPLTSIDIDATLIHNLSPTTGRDEAEITLKTGAPVWILGVKNQIDGEYASPLDHGLEPIQMTAKTIIRYPHLANVLSNSNEQSAQNSPIPQDGKSGYGHDTVAPDPDDSYQREEQLQDATGRGDMGMPETAKVPVREALLRRPSNLGTEDHFSPCPVKYPNVYKMMKPEFMPVEKKAVNLEAPVKKEEPKATPPPAPKAEPETVKKPADKKAEPKEESSKEEKTKEEATKKVVKEKPEPKEKEEATSSLLSQILEAKV